MKQYDESKEPSGMIPVQRLKGQYVRRKPDAKATYKVVGYDRGMKKWCLDDTADVSRCIYVKAGTLLFAGFSY